MVYFILLQAFLRVDLFNRFMFFINESQLFIDFLAMFPLPIHLLAILIQTGSTLFPFICKALLFIVDILQFIS